VRGRIGDTGPVTVGGAPVRGRAAVNQATLQTLDLLSRALRLMDQEGKHHVAARIAMAIDDLRPPTVVGAAPPTRN